MEGKEKMGEMRDNMTLEPGKESRAETIKNEIEVLGRRAKEASRTAAKLTAEEKVRGLLSVAAELQSQTEYLLAENEKDLRMAEEKGVKASLIDRLRLNKERIAGMAEGLSQVAALDDIVGEVLEMKKRPNGLRIDRKSVV